MQRKLTFDGRSEDEEIKDAGLVLDFDEIARRGSMSKEEKSVAKWYGIYSSRQPGNHMARIVVPGGVMTSDQARKIARVAERYAMGTVSITTRQSIQLHWLKAGKIAEVMRELAEEGCTTRHGAGDVTRNTTACPLAETCKYRRFNVLIYARKTAKYLGDAGDLDNLPRKFKVGYSGCSGGCAQPYINCVGAIAVLKADAGVVERGFKVVIGGGMGATPHVARDLFGFVPEHDMLVLTRAIARLFRDHGDRFNRAKARLKFVVDRYGIEKCRRIIVDNLAAEGVSMQGFEVDPITDAGPTVPDRPLAEEDPVGTDGLATVRMMVVKGELGYRQLLTVAELSEVYGDQLVRTTNRQNLEIHGVECTRLEEVKRLAREAGFGTSGFFGLRDVVSCVGTTYCPKAVVATRDLHDLLMPVLTKPKYAGIEKKAIINVTGCPNACSPYTIADIGFRGMRIRGEVGSVEGYEVVVGGSPMSFAQQVGEFKRGDCPQVVETLLDTFLSLRSSGETLTACVGRVGLAPFKREVFRRDYDYRKAANPTELSVVSGAGRSLLDMKTLAKDVPCEAACPAKTRVPAYIDLIARGRNDDAYRINQEDNVFPGVLGRVCTRPCEPACRHTWTGVEGPVQICHLKRSAAENLVEPPKPLGAWFDDTAFRVAVVGGGPAGLTAARELKRYGHGVTVYERSDRLGGKMIDGIPRFRLPIEVVEQEIRLIVDSGIEVRLGSDVNAGMMASLASDYDAVCVATGTMRAKTFLLEGLEGPDRDSVISGLEFMRRYNAGEITEMKGDVVVVGGGFTAVDCARSCARAARCLVGADDRVTMAYRRTRGAMSADREEIEEIKLEQIDVRTLVTPVSITTENGDLKGVVMRRNKLAEESEGAKPLVVPIPDSEFELPCRYLIVAIGQEQEWEILPEAVTLGDSPKTSMPKVFVAGDFLTGSLDVIRAVSSGKAAADEIDRFLTGEVRKKQQVWIDLVENDGVTGRLRDHDLQHPHAMPLRTILERATGDVEVEKGLDKEAIRVAATRCYLCNYKFEIDQDKCIHCAWCIDAAPRDCIKKVSRIFTRSDGGPPDYVATDRAAEATYIYIDSDNCIRCGKCVRACPTDAISMRRMTRTAYCEIKGASRRIE